MVYDYLPDALFERLENLPDFRAVLAFDKWIGNADSRQAIFFRARVQDGLTGLDDQTRLGFVAQMMDNGFIFEGPHFAIRRVGHPRAVFPAAGIPDGAGPGRF